MNTPTLNRSNMIGKGKFTKAYLVDNRVRLESVDPAKECIALFCQGVSKHIPKIEKEFHSHVSIYSMPLYHPLKASNTKAWADYKAVKSFIDGVGFVLNPHDKLSNYYTKLEQNKTIRPALKKALFNIINEMGNYTTAIFMEISPRNAMVDNKGNLILLDIIGDTNLLREIKQRGGIK